LLRTFAYCAASFLWNGSNSSPFLIMN
jgi:hypothetical protein